MFRVWSNLKYNLNLLNTVALIYPEVKVRVMWLMCGISGGFCRASVFPKREVEYVAISGWLLFRSGMRATLMHELGHAFHPTGIHSNRIIAEVSAWKWALQNTPEISSADIGRAVAAMTTYMASHEDTKPLTEEMKLDTYRIIVDTFVKRWL